MRILRKILPVLLIGIGAVYLVKSVDKNSDRDDEDNNQMGLA